MATLREKSQPKNEQLGYKNCDVQDGANLVLACHKSTDTRMVVLPHPPALACLRRNEREL
jgi:hypothetical protein